MNTYRVPNHTGPKHLHVLYRYIIIVKIQCIQHEHAHTHMHAHTFRLMCARVRVCVRAHARVLAHVRAHMHTTGYTFLGQHKVTTLCRIATREGGGKEGLFQQCSQLFLLLSQFVFQLLQFPTLILHIAAYQSRKIKL